MKRILGLFILALFLSSASWASAKDYQVTGPVVDVDNDSIVVKKGTENWEIARDKNTKTSGDIKKGERREGGSFQQRICKYASWNSYPAESVYLVKTANDFLSA